MEDHESLHAKYLKLRKAFQYPACRQLSVADLANYLRLINELAKAYFLAPNLQDGIKQYLRLNGYTTEELFEIGYQLIDVHLDWVAMPYLLRAFESDNSERIMSELICAFEGFGYHKEAAELCTKYPHVCQRSAIISYMWGFDSIHAGLLQQSSAVLKRLQSFGADAKQLIPQLEGFVQRARVLYPTQDVIQDASIRTWNYILNASLLLEVNSHDGGYFPVLYDNAKSLGLLASSILKVKSLWAKNSFSDSIKKIYYSSHPSNTNLIFAKIISTALNITEVVEMTEESENEAGLFVCYNASTMSKFARVMQNRNPHQIWWAHQVSTSNLQFSCPPISPDIIGLISFYHEIPFDSNKSVEDSVSLVLNLLQDPNVQKVADPEFEEICNKAMQFKGVHGLLLTRDELCRRTRFRNQPVVFEEVDISEENLLKEARKSCEQKEYEWSNHLVCRYLDKHPNDVEALFLQYEVYCAMEATLHDQALSDIRDKQLDRIQQLLMSSAINNPKFFSKIENSIGRAKFKQGKFFESETHLKKATELDPTNVEYQHSLATLYATNGLIGDASEIADKFKEADVFDQLRTQLNALMYGTTWGQNSTTSDAKAEDEENKGEESEEETLSGVKATVLYDHNAMMLGTAHDDGVFIHPYWLYNFGMPDAAVTIRRLIDFMTVFKWPINCLIAADTAALPVALTIAAKFNLILKTASSVKENDVPLYITFVWNSSSAGFVLKKIRSKCASVYSFSMAVLSSDGYSIPDMIGIITPRASSNFCWAADEAWADYMASTAPPMIPEKKLEKQEVESEGISSFFPRTLHNAYQELYHQATDGQSETNIEQQIDCYYSAKHLRAHLKPRGQRVKLIRDKQYDSIDEKIADKLSEISNDEHKIDEELLKEIKENIPAHPQILAILKNSARKTPNASVLSLILEHDFDASLIQDLLIENPSSAGAKSLIFMIHKRKEMLEIIMNNVDKMLEDNAQQSGFFLEKLFTKLDPTVFEPWADQLLETVKNNLKDASDMENNGHWLGSALATLAYLRPKIILEFVEKTILPLSQTIDELSYAVEQLLTGTADAIVISARQFPLQEETDLIRKLVHENILKQAIRTPYLKFLLFVLDHGFVDETLEEDLQAIQSDVFDHLSSAVDAHFAKKMTLLLQAGKLPRDTVVEFAREFLLSDKHVPKEMVSLLVRYCQPQDSTLLLKFSRSASYLASLGLIKLGHERFRRVVTDVIEKFTNQDSYSLCLTCLMQVAEQEQLDIVFSQFPRQEKWPLLAKALVINHEYLAASPYFVARWAQLPIKLKQSLVHEAMHSVKSRGCFNFMYQLEAQTVRDWASKLDLNADLAIVVQFLNFLSHNNVAVDPAWSDAFLKKVSDQARDFVLQSRAKFHLTHPGVKFDTRNRFDDLL